MVQPCESKAATPMPSSTRLCLAILVSCQSSRLKLVELLDLLASAGKHAEDVEADLRFVSNQY